MPSGGGRKVSHFDVDGKAYEAASLLSMHSYDVCGLIGAFALLEHS